MSVLDPVLFLVNVNDMSDKIDSEVFLFTDDVKLMRIHTGVHKESLQMDPDMLQDWSDKWLLEFSLSKCKVMKTGEGQKHPETVYRLGKQRLQLPLKRTSA